MPVILATSGGGLDAADAIAKGISTGGLHYIIGLMAIVILGLFGWLMRVNALRISDRDTFQEKLEALSMRVMDTVLRGSESNLLLTRAVDELRAGKRRAAAALPEVRQEGPK